MRKSLVFLGTSGLKTRPAASLSGAGWAAACRERRIGDCKIGAGQGRGHVNHTAAPSMLAAHVHHGHGREVAAAKGGSAGDRSPLTALLPAKRSREGREPGARVGVGYGPSCRYRYRQKSIPRSSIRCEATWERQRQMQGTEVPGCADAAQPLGSDVGAQGEGRRRPPGRRGFGGIG